MIYCTDKDIDKLIRQLVREGWTFRWGGKHGRLIAPNGEALTVSASPSDYRSFNCFRRQVEKIKRRMMVGTVKEGTSLCNC
jgi:hypothetical protein